MTEHIPVLRDEILQCFIDQQAPLENFMDGTFGRGGHTSVLLDHFPKLRVFAFDRDPEAISFGEKNFEKYVAQKRLVFVRDNFKNFAHHGLPLLDGALIDLGVSSPQLNVAERGFSFMHDGPLDMRMDPSQELTAEEIIHTFSEDELNELFKSLGEVRSPYRVVRALVHDRKTKKFSTTKELASLIERIEGWRKRGVHPATQYFLALRMQVNGELSALDDFVEELSLQMNPGARIALISFHSLEDRILKTKTRELDGRDLVQLVNRKVIAPSREEELRNPRSRSAKLRVIERASQHE